MTRPPGTGTVSKRKDGRWTAAAFINGKRVWRYAHSEAEAHLKLARLLSGVEELEPRPSLVEMSLEAWVDKWLRDQKNDLRLSTLRTYRQTLEMVTEVIGDVFLTELTPLMLSNVFTALVEQGKGRRRIHLAHGYLRACLQRAVDLELISRNPMEKVKKPKWEASVRVYWDIEETLRFLAECQMQWTWGPFFTVLTTAGIRVSEALALTWQDVSRDCTRITITKSLVWAGQEKAQERPKTPAGTRHITLPAIAAEALKKQREVQPANPGGAVFRSTTGAVPQPGHIRDMLDDMCRRCNVPRINPHGLRHVHAMLALEITRDPYLVQRRLGHANVSVTVGTYGYSRHDDKRVATGLDELVTNGSEKE